MGIQSNIDSDIPEGEARAFMSRKNCSNCHWWDHEDDHYFRPCSSEEVHTEIFVDGGEFLPGKNFKCNFWKGRE